jgi:hypothetical protein
LRENDGDNDGGDDGGNNGVAALKEKTENKNK